MNNKHKSILEAIFKLPTQANIKWKDIEALFIHLGARVVEGRGSRVRIILNGIPANFHRPHPRREATKGAVEAARRFLKDTGAYNDKI